jgi:7-carboxy-7-deazaguanine synthase
MRVNELFYSIQGESSFAGRPCAFIRLTGCDLRCTYCDTTYAYYEGREMSVREIVDQVSAYPTSLVLITGGEPMLQPSVTELFRDLLARNYQVCLETGGHIDLNGIDPRVHKIMDLKCPSSGMASHNNFDNIPALTQSDEVKFVVGNHADFVWACDMIRRFDLCSRAGTILFSPLYNQLPYDELARWVLESGLPVRLQVQLHKIIWPGRERGV